MGEMTKAEAQQVIRFSVPLPPKELRANSRAFWAAKKKSADAYSEVVYDAWNWSAPPIRFDVRLPVGAMIDRVIQELDTPWPDDSTPWQRARVTYIWRYCGAKPDHSNLGQHTKYLQDIICVAPRLSPEQAAKYKRWHLGIVENDSEIEAVFKLEKVPRRRDEQVIVTIERLGEGG